VWGWRAANQLHYLWLQRQLMSCNLPDGPIQVDRNYTVTNAVKWPAAAQVLMPTRNWVYPIFIHKRFTPAGSPRLVMVTDNVVANASNRQIFVDAVAYVPADIAPGSSLRASAGAVIHHGAIRIHSGQADTVDQSHFTIAYETDRGSGTIDGWLMNDTIKLEVRDGPLR